MTGKHPRISMIDSHTGGEPTRVIVDGAPDLGNGSVAEKLKVLKSNFDWLRTATVCEPRGSEVWVGAVLCSPSDPSCVAGAIFYNSVGYLGMCGHGSIGVVKTLAHLGRIKVGTQRLETPVGIVSTTLHADGSVSITNVPSYRKEKSVRLESAAMGDIAGDIAWGGNWFYLIEADQLALSLEHEPKLREITWQIMRDINSQGFPEVDHIELFGPPLNRLANSPQFCVVPRRRVRSIAMRHGHQCQTCLPGRRRKTGRRRRVGTGKLHRKLLFRTLQMAG